MEETKSLEDIKKCVNEIKLPSREFVRKNGHTGSIYLAIKDRKDPVYLEFSTEVLYYSNPNQLRQHLTQTFGKGVEALQHNIAWALFIELSDNRTFALAKRTRHNACDGDKAELYFVDVSNVGRLIPRKVEGTVDENLQILKDWTCFVAEKLCPLVTYELPSEEWIELAHTVCGICSSTNLTSLQLLERIRKSEWYEIVDELRKEEMRQQRIIDGEEEEEDDEEAESED